MGPSPKFSVGKLPLPPSCASRHLITSMSISLGLNQSKKSSLSCINVWQWLDNFKYFQYTYVKWLDSFKYFLYTYVNTLGRTIIDKRNLMITISEYLSYCRKLFRVPWSQFTLYHYVTTEDIVKCYHFGLDHSW